VPALPPAGLAVNEESYTFAQAQDLALALGAVSKIHSAV